MSSQTYKLENPSAVAPASERIARMLIMGIFGGIAAGFLVGGIGSQLIMRILGMVNGVNDRVITAGGTFEAIIVAGLVSGVIGGLVYVVIRRWLPGGKLLKGLV